MRTVVSFASPAGDALARVRAISGWMRWLTLCVGLLASVVVGLFWFWTTDGELDLAVREIVRSAPSYATRVSLWHRWAGFVMTGAGLGLMTYALYQAHRILTAFARGSVFSMDIAIRLRRMALALLALGPAIPLLRTVLGLLLVDMPSGPYWTIQISVSEFFLCLIGGLLLAIAWTLVEATRIAEENQSFV